MISKRWKLANANHSPRAFTPMEIPSVTRALGLHEQYLARLIKILGIK
jgi:hypothetical protein